MFADYLLDYISASYYNKILLLDDEGLALTAGVPDKLMALGFDVVIYKDDLSFRIEHETKLKSDEVKIVVIANSKNYIPYDIRRRLRSYSMSLNNLFPNSTLMFSGSRINLTSDLPVWHTRRTSITSVAESRQKIFCIIRSMVKKMF